MVLYPGLPIGMAQGEGPTKVKLVSLLAPVLRAVAVRSPVAAFVVLVDEGIAILMKLPLLHL